jgi:hypothetical protein
MRTTSRSVATSIGMMTNLWKIVSYVVRDDERSNTWELTMFRAERIGETMPQGGVP